ncbi:cation diffusion facilitator family transporter [Paenibacillus sp. 1001270B_150601_E10]|uniref:cation diffusion facilitator family transporter n=1 Tax=Paenibacillus sp. 1001270B_150601_E10 TaxID=2787079 RepID=UPI00189D3F1F|nr:cation diffusion facilitator family transporter [Paenibacillus sp. 1001270B_150601_E10]
MGHHHDHSHSHHDHSHGHHDHAHGISRQGNRKGLLIAFLITVTIMVLEFAGGLITNSLALLSDSGHMLSDASSLLLSLIAVSFAARPPSSNKTYGYYRFEILAAFINGITLFVVAGYIIYEAIERFVDPPKVASGTMMIIAVIGLLANLLSAWSLMRKGNVEDNINVKSAYLHVIGDALGSVGAIIAGLLMLLFGWYIADPIISVVVALLILKSAWGVLQQSTHILMEGTPVGMNQADIQKSLRAIAGVVDVHDLHIWSITSNMDSFSCHIVIEDTADSQTVLQEAILMMAEQYHIEHTTIQVETSRIHHESLHEIKG